MSATHRVATVVRRLGLDRSRVWLTRAVGVVTLTVSVAAFASPALMQVLTRNVAQMRAG
ncbi:MAG: hypothetical protein ABI083_08200 [Lapillicoccus sp.]